MASACWKQVFILTDLFKIVVSDFRVNEFTRFSRVLVVTKLVVNGNQCIILSTGCNFFSVIFPL